MGLEGVELANFMNESSRINSQEFEVFFNSIIKTYGCPIEELNIDALRDVLAEYVKDFMLEDIP